MQFFKDIYFPIDIKFYMTQYFKTSSEQLQTLNGDIFHAPETLVPKRYYRGDNILLTKQEAKILHDFYQTTRGSVFTFRFTDDFSFKTSVLENEPTATDIIIGQGDGITTEFPLFIVYDTEKYDNILPVILTFRTAISGSEISNEDYVIQDYQTLVFDIAPAEGAVITAGFHYDFITRFTVDGLSFTADKYRGGFKASFMLE